MNIQSAQAMYMCYMCTALVTERRRMFARICA